MWISVKTIFKFSSLIFLVYDHYFRGLLIFNDDDNSKQWWCFSPGQLSTRNHSKLHSLSWQEGNILSPTSNWQHMGWETYVLLQQTHIRFWLNNLVIASKFSQPKAGNGTLVSYTSKVLFKFVNIWCVESTFIKEKIYKLVKFLPSCFSILRKFTMSFMLALL